MNPGTARQTQSSSAQPQPGVMLDGPAVSSRRVLVVGDDRFADQVQQAFQQARLVVKLQVVGDYLMALGQAAHVPPDVVIGQASLLGSQRHAIVTGLRRLAPRARLLVAGSSDQHAHIQSAMEAGFDGKLAQPLDPHQITHHLLPLLPAEAPEIPDSPADPSPSTYGQSSPVGLAAASRDSLEGLSGMPGGDDVDPAASDEGDDRWLSGWPASEQRPAPQTDFAEPSSPARPPVKAEAAGVPAMDDPYEHADSELGDIDLVDCLLARPGEFKELVLRLVSSRSGIASLGFAGQAQEVPPGHVGVWVTFRHARLGVLHAPPPTVKSQLAPWASWMGHWLALEHRTTTLWDMAHRDDLSGAWNRRYFDRYLSRVLTQAARKRFPVTLLVFDIDNFKTYNDRYGHAAGDEILRETVKLMRSVIREHDVVARIGGDEFAVIFWDPHGPRKPNSSHPDDVREAARRFQQAICRHRFPKLHEQAPGTLSISGGLASFPWDGATPQALLERADAMLLHSKAQGKNAITLGAGARRAGDPFTP